MLPCLIKAKFHEISQHTGVGAWIAAGKRSAVAVWLAPANSMEGAAAECSRRQLRERGLKPCDEALRTPLLHGAAIAPLL